MVRSDDNFVPVVDGPQAVANAFYLVLDEIGWGCDYVGHADGVEACQLESATGPRNNGGSFKQGAVTILALLANTIFWGYSAWLS
eukprot:scaffold7406_cov122-Skeletonema_dohrnii-CCMP3373.AAC.1